MRSDKRTERPTSTLWQLPNKERINLLCTFLTFAAFFCTDKTLSLWVGLGFCMFCIQRFDATLVQKWKFCLNFCINNQK